VVRKGDVIVAKNYLNEREIEELNRIVTMFLEFAEDHARRRKQVFMRNWREKLDQFLSFNERDVLANVGKISRDSADKLALGEYDEFHRGRLAEMDSKAEQETLEALEDLAKTLPKRKKPARKEEGKHQ